MRDMKEEQKAARNEARRILQYGNLVDLQLPSWATSLVVNFRKDADIPDEVNDVTLFVAIESNRVCTYNPEYQTGALRIALGLPLRKEDEVTEDN